MTPSPSPNAHMGPPQSIPSPFNVTVNKSYYKAGEPVQVTISGADIFKGILVQAREVGKDAAIGTFSDNLPSGVRHLMCGNAKNTVTHREPLSLKTITLDWLPPSDITTMGKISFFATVVKDRMTFWVKLESPELSKMEVTNTMTTEDVMTRYVTSTPQLTTSTQAMTTPKIYASTHMSKDGEQTSTYNRVRSSMMIYATKSSDLGKQSSKVNVSSTTNPPTSSAYAFSPIASPLLFYAAFLLLV